MASGSKKGRKSRSGSGSKKGSKSRSGSGSKKKGSNSGSGEKVFPSESYEIYLKQVADSEGFDVDHFPAVKKHIPGIVSPVPDGAFTRGLVARYAKLAIDHYNMLHKTAYEFVKVLKATYGMLNGIEYFITFDAKERYAADAKTFQAKVEAFPGNDLIKLVRLRKPPSPPPHLFPQCLFLDIFPPHLFPQHPLFPHPSSKVTPPSPAPSVPDVFPQVPIKRERKVNLHEIPSKRERERMQNLLEVRRAISTLSI